MNNLNIRLPVRYKRCLFTALFTVLISANTWAGEHATHYRYNKMGEVVGEISAKNVHSNQHNYVAKRYTLNSKGQLTKIETGRLSSTPAVSQAPYYWYSAFSGDTQLIKSYNADGELISDEARTATNVKISKTIYDYDNYGRLTCQKQVMNLSSHSSACTNNDSNTADGYSRITLYEYNAFDKITKEYRATYSPQSQLYKEYTYGAYLNISAVYDANRNKTSYEYEDYGRLEYVRYPSKTSTASSNTYDYERYTYDNNSNMLSFRKRSRSTIYYEYDNLNRLIRKDLPGTKDIYYDYDLRGLKLYSKFYSDSITQQGVAHTYDGFGRMLTESHKHLWHANLTNQYEYDKHGNRTKLTYPDGQVVEYTYDAMDRINTIDLPGVSSDVVYTYNAQAMRTYTQRPNSTSTNYDYDPAMRMDEISENLSGNAGDNTFLYTFNPANQIKTLSVSNQTYAVDHSAQGRPGKYETNGLNQYTKANGGILDYDTDGNLTLDEQEDAVYEYSIENQLTKVIKNGTITELGYDATGKLLNIGNTYFLYDGEAIIAEYNQQDCYPCGRTMTKRYVHSVGIDDPILQYNSSGTSSYLMTYLHKNHQGSIVAGSAYTGSLTYTNGYDSFGVPEPSNQGRFAYTGQIYLEEIELYYYKARIYHPKLGRFLQTDPVGYEDQMNLYAYVGNDPLNMRDPTGEWGVQIGAGIIGFAIGAISEAVSNENASFGSVMKAGGAGAAVGVATTFGGGLFGTMIVGGVANGLGEVANQAIDGEFNPVEVGEAIAIGIVGGAVAKGAAKIAVAGRGLPNNTATQASNSTTASSSQRVLADSRTLSSTPANRAVAEVKLGGAYGTGAAAQATHQQTQCQNNSC